MYIVCIGHLVKGLAFHGPFDTYEEAMAWGQKLYDDSGFYIAELNRIVEEARNV